MTDTTRAAVERLATVLETPGESIDCCTIAATLRALLAERDFWREDSRAAWGKCEERRLAQEKAETERDAARAEAARLRDTATTSDDEDAITAEDEDRAFLGYSDEDDDDE